MQSGPLLAAVMAAEAADRDLLGTEAGIKLVRAVIELASEHGVEHLYPAGAGGERLAGAAMALARGRLRVWDCRSNQPVIVLDGVVASVAGVRQAMAMATRLGASAVVGVAIEEPNSPVIDGSEDVTVLSPVARTSNAA